MPPSYPAVDNWQEWSHNGQLIAYHRRYWSSDGPAGVYVIDAGGGSPRFLAPGHFWSPTYLRFSPDDRYLSCVLGFQLLLIDLQTGAVSQPIYTQNGVTQPDWSPDGRTIVYSRQFYSFGDPPESLGLHLLDLATGTDQPVYYQGQPKLGRYPVWSKDGKSIAFTDGEGDYFRVALLPLDGSDLVTIARSAQGAPGLGNLRRHVRTSLGIDGLVFGGFTPEGVGPFFINWDGSGMQHMPPTYYYDYAYSPDGSQVVRWSVDLTDSLPGLFVFSVDDITGATARQLTRYDPPPGASVNTMSLPADPPAARLDP